MPRSEPLPVAQMTIVAILVETMLAGGGAALLADLALVAVVVAASERRHKAMLIAAGLACGLAGYGAMLLPLAFGIAVRRRVGTALLLLVPLTAAATAAASGTLPLPDGRGMIGLWAIAPDRGADALILAIGLGALAWATAMLTTLSLHGRALISAATMMALGAVLLIPQTSMAVPVALAVVAVDRRVRAAAAAATVLAAYAQPLAATFVLLPAMMLLARPLLRPASNDNSRFALVR